MEIEIGPERGTFLLAVAAENPTRNYLGIEMSSPRARRLERSLAQGGLENARVLCADAACAIAACVPDASVAAYHIYFPDPWWKRRHHRRRLLTRDFVAELARTLEDGGAVHLVTDVEAIHAFSMRNLRAEAALVEAGTPPERRVRTAYELKALARGDRLYFGSLRKEPAGVERRSA